MLEEILPEIIYKSIKTLNYSNLCEIRFRVGKPITVNYNNSYYFLGESGLCNEKNSFLCSKETIQSILHLASNFSIYSINEEIKQGYISVRGGIRIGLAGEIVVEANKILTIKNFSSINIRIPHEILGASNKIIKYLFNDLNLLLNTLIIGSPATGKTTLIRDLCNQISKKNPSQNILLLDERQEIASCFNSEAQLNVGNSTDIISGGSKATNIINGIRSMSPNIICIDEIGGIEDINSIEYAVNCGVSIISTIHCKNIFELTQKKEMINLLKNKNFKRYVEISNNNGKGTIEDIYDENMKSVIRQYD